MDGIDAALLPLSNCVAGWIHTPIGKKTIFVTRSCPQHIYM